MLCLIGLFWLGTCFAGSALIQGLHHSPIHAVLAVYALAVILMVSLPAALLTILVMIITHPRYTTADTAADPTSLPHTSGDAFDDARTFEKSEETETDEEVEAAEESHWWFDEDIWHDKETA